MNRAGATNCCFASTMKPLCSHSVRFVYDCTVAEDLVSEVFYQLWRTSAYQRVRGPFLSYLFAAVRNEAYTGKPLTTFTIQHGSETI